MTVITTAVVVAKICVQKYQIAFEGVIGNSSLSFQGDIAIDDIKIENRACPPIGFCDFESKQIFCSWSNIEGNDDFDWEEGSKDTGLLGLGPDIFVLYSYLWINCIDVIAPKKKTVGTAKAWMVNQRNVKIG